MCAWAAVFLEMQPKIIIHVPDVATAGCQINRLGLQLRMNFDGLTTQIQQTENNYQSL